MSSNASDERRMSFRTGMFFIALVGILAVTYDTFQTPGSQYAMQATSQVAASGTAADSQCPTATAKITYNSAKQCDETYPEGGITKTNKYGCTCQDPGKVVGKCVAQNDCKAVTCLIDGTMKPCSKASADQLEGAPTSPSGDTATAPPTSGETPPPTAGPANTQPFENYTGAPYSQDTPAQDVTQQRLDNVNSQIENCAYGGCSQETMNNLTTEQKTLQDSLNTNVGTLQPGGSQPASLNTANISGYTQYTNFNGAPTNAAFPNTFPSAPTSPSGDTFNYNSLPPGSSPSGYFPQGSPFSQFSTNNAPVDGLPVADGSWAGLNTVPGYGPTNLNAITPSNDIPEEGLRDIGQPPPPNTPANSPTGGVTNGEVKPTDPTTDAKNNPTTPPPGQQPPGQQPPGKQTDAPAPRPTNTPSGPTGPSSPSGPGSPSQSPGGQNPLSSLLNGLMQGLMRAMQPQSPAQPAQACSTDPNIYAQQQQQYQQQLQQYNYQLQQYQYQQQLALYQQNSGGGAYGNPYGYNPYLSTPLPAQPTPCTPQTTQQCTTQSTQPAASTCTTGFWQPQYSGTCIVNWQCITTSTTTPGSAPTAALSCSPSLADVGMSVAVNYSCSSGTASSSAFTVTSQPSGVATTTLTQPPAGANTATYLLTCTDQGRTSGAQCSIQINQPSIVLVANPKTVRAGETSLIGWVTTGMQSCVIASPDQAAFTTANSSNTSVAGTAVTDPVSHASTFVLSCTTATGQSRVATTSVDVLGTTSTVSITSNASSTVSHGDTISLSWQSGTQAAGSAIALWLVDIATDQTTALIAGAQPLSGSYIWHVPTATSTCPNDSFNVCGGDLVPGRTYAIEADVYSPANAYVGDGPAPANPVDPQYGDFADTGVFVLGQ